MKFNEPVQVVTAADGSLSAPVPAKAVAELKLQPGDVLCWTAHDDGTVEVWRVAQNPYQTLDERRR